MKQIYRIFALLLVSVMLFAFVSCGDDTPTDTNAPHNTVAYVADALKSSLPTKAVTQSTYVIDDLTLKGSATLLVNRTGNIMDAKYEYRVEVLNPAGTTDINGNPLMIGVITDTKYSKGDMVASFNPETGDATYSVYDVANQLSGMAIPQSGTVTEAADGAVTLTAEVAAADAEAVFGVKINATGSIRYTITVKDGKLVQFTASYSTALGQMTVQTDYSYAKVSFDVTAPESN